MMIVMREGASADEVRAVISRVEETGAHAHVSTGDLTTVIGVIGDREHVANLGLEAEEGVDNVVAILKPYKLASSDYKRGARTVIDQLHRCLTAWLAPVLIATAEEAWLARFPDEQDSVHLQPWPSIPEAWRDDALAAKWTRVREQRGSVTTELEALRTAKVIGASLQAAVALDPAAAALLNAEQWAEVLIVSDVTFADTPQVAKAPGQKCERCWKVLPEVGISHAHPTLCRRCEAVVSA